MLTKVSKNGKLTQCLEYIFMHPHFLFLSFIKRRKDEFCFPKFLNFFVKNKLSQNNRCMKTKKKEKKRIVLPHLTSLNS
jgi:hypothetical protein